MPSTLQRAAIGLILLAGLALPASAATPHSDRDAARPLVMGIAPFMSPLALVKRLEPLRAYLATTLGQDIRLETTTRPKDFAFRTLNGRYDLLLSSPSFALRALDRGNYRLLATQDQAMRGNLIVMADSPIHTVDGLANKLIGAPPEQGFLGQLTRPYLKHLGLTGTRAPTIRHFHSHNDAYHALRMNNLDAAFIADLVLKHLQKNHAAVRIIARTEAQPGLCVLAASALDDDFRQALRKAILELEQHPDGALALKQASLPAFRAITPEELEVVRPYMSAIKH